MRTSFADQGWQHTHVFDEGNPLAERNTKWAVALTAVMMVVEIVGGWRFNSMALLADGWHMSSHVLALGLAALPLGALAYRAGVATTARLRCTASRCMPGSAVILARRITVQELARHRHRDGGADRPDVCGRTIGVLRTTLRLRLDRPTAVTNRRLSTHAHASTPRTHYRRRV